MASGTLTCETGVFTLTMGESTSYTNRTLVAATGVFALTLGTSTALSYTDRTLNAEPGSFALTGRAATLNHGVTARTLVAETGHFVLAGDSAISRRIADHAPGSFVLTGYPATLTKGEGPARTLSAEKGIFGLTGNPATLTGPAGARYTLVAGTGVFTLNLGGSTSLMLMDRRLVATPGHFVLTGKAANLFTPDHRLRAEAGFFSGTYHDAILTKAGGPRSLPAYVLGHANDPAQVVPYLVEIMLATPWRWTTFGRPIYALSHVWENYAVQVSGLSAGLYDAAECVIGIGDGNDVVAAADLSTTKGLVGTFVNVYEAWLDPATFELRATVQKFRGKVKSVVLDLTAASLSCGPWVSFSGKDLPRWIATTICPYTYKDGRCGYSGGLPACLKTYADCTAHANTARFGGFRSLPKPNTKIVWAEGTWSLKEPA